MEHANPVGPTPSPSEEGNSLWLLLDILDKTHLVTFLKTQLPNNQKTQYKDENLTSWEETKGVGKRVL